MAMGNHALYPVLAFRAEARPHHDLSTGEVLLDLIPEADKRRGHWGDGAHCHSYREASWAIFRISTGVADPETVAITNSRSKERPSIGRVTRPGAAAERSGRMQIAWPSATTRCTQFSLSVRKRGDRAHFDKSMRGTPRVLTDKRG